MTEHLMNTYSRLPVTFVKGEGCWLHDDKGNKYLDAIAGIAVCSLGHCHPAVSKAICEQANTLIHTSNIYGIEHQSELANKLTEMSGMDKVFFSNSGAEANEAAIKIARLYGHKQGIKKPQIIVMENSFHGRTLATLTATGNRKVQAGFEPLVPGFIRIPYDDIETLETTIANQKDVVAVMLEPVQGESGVNIPEDDYLNKVREICDQHKLLMMLDEIQTGMARTGKFFSCQHNGIVPDVMTLAKALGNGVPIGACLGKGEAAELFMPGNHGSTYGGNPLVCKVALNVVDTMQQGQFDQKAKALGDYLLAGFNKELADVEGIKEIRGKGLMLAIELDEPCAELVKLALDYGLLINVAGNTNIRLLPPIIMTNAEADELISKLSGIVKTFLS